MSAGAALRHWRRARMPDVGVARQRWVPESLRWAGYRSGPMQPRSPGTARRSVQQLAIVALAIVAPLLAVGHVGAERGSAEQVGVERGGAARTTTTTRAPTTTAPPATTVAPTTEAPTTTTSASSSPSGTPPTAGVSTTTPVLQDRVTESSQATTRLNRVVIGLVALAAIIAAATVFFWIRTRPDKAGRQRGSRPGRRGATLVGADGSEQPLIASRLVPPSDDRWAVDPAPQLASSPQVTPDSAGSDHGGSDHGGTTSGSATPESGRG